MASLRWDPHWTAWVFIHPNTICSLFILIIYLYIYMVGSFKDFLCFHFHQNFTPQKLNIDIKNYGLEDVVHFNCLLLGIHVKFPGGKEDYEDWPKLTNTSYICTFLVSVLASMILFGNMWERWKILGEPNKLPETNLSPFQRNFWVDDVPFPIGGDICDRSLEGTNPAQWRSNFPKLRSIPPSANPSFLFFPRGEASGVGWCWCWKTPRFVRPLSGMQSNMNQYECDIQFLMLWGKGKKTNAEHEDPKGNLINCHDFKQPQLRMHKVSWRIYDETPVWFSWALWSATEFTRWTSLTQLFWKHLS